MPSQVKSGFITARPSPKSRGVDYAIFDWGEQIAVSIKPALMKNADYLRTIINSGEAVVLVAKKTMPADMRVGTLKPNYKVIDQVPIDRHPLMTTTYSALAIEIATAMSMQRWESWQKGTMFVPEDDTPDEEILAN
jgi:hypothetical protein